MHDITPIGADTVDRFMRLYRELCRTVNDEASVEVFAERLGWSVEYTRVVATWLRDRALIETDAGMGDEIAVIEGRSGT
jgi:hypothetical protein